MQYADGELAFVQQLQVKIQQPEVATLKNPGKMPGFSDTLLFAEKLEIICCFSSCHCTENIKATTENDFEVD